MSPADSSAIGWIGDVTDIPKEPKAFFDGLGTSKITPEGGMAVWKKI